MRVDLALKGFEIAFPQFAVLVFVERQQVTYLLHHDVEIPGKGADFIVTGYGNGDVEVSFFDLFDGFTQVLDGCENPGGDAAAHGEKKDDSQDYPGGEGAEGGEEGGVEVRDVGNGDDFPGGEGVLTDGVDALAALDAEAEGAVSVSENLVNGFDEEAAVDELVFGVEDEGAVGGGDVVVVGVGAVLEADVFDNVDGDVDEEDAGGRGSARGGR